MKKRLQGWLWVNSDTRASRSHAESAKLRKSFAHRHFRAAIATAARSVIEPLESRMMLSTVTWTGKGDGTSWTDPNNWNSDAVPTSVDNVVINAIGTSVSINTNVAVADISSTANLDVSGSFSVSAGQSTISGMLTLEGGSSLSASGSNTSLLANGSADIDGSNLFANGGSTLSLPAATSYAGSTSHNTGTTTFQASGSGSVLSLPNLVTLTGCTDNWGGDYLNITASSGGLVQIPKVTTLPAGTYDISASGTGSAVQLPLVTLLTSSQGTSQINAASGGNVMMPLLTTLDGTAVSVDASSSFNTSQISTFVNSSTTVTGYAANYGSVSNASGSTFSLNGGSLNLNNASDIDLASFYVTGGSTLSLPAATSYAGSTSHNTGTTTFQASGSGSVLSLPNLVTLTGCTDNWGGDYLNITASSGGLVQIPKVTTLPAGTYDISASGTGSAVQLPLVTLLTSSQGTSQINAASGGNVMMPLLTTLDGTAVSVDASSSFNTSQISTFVNSSTTVTGYAANYGSVSNASGSTFSLNGGSLNLNNASDIDLASFYVTGGSTLSLPAATSYAGSTSHNTGTTTFQASGSGSVLSLPNLVTLTGCTDNWGGDYLNITASSGGLVQIPKVTTLPAGTYDISASGTGSAVQLPLVTLLTSSQGTSQINAASGGNVMMPLLTTLDGTAVSVDASSSFNTSQISTFVNSSTTVTGYAANYGSVSNASGSTFSLNGGSLNLNNASDIDLASFYVTGGSTLSLPAATSYAGSTSHNTGTTTFQASGSGSVLSLPNLVTLTGCTDNWGGDYLNITASSGGLVQIPKVTTLPAGTYDISASGTGSAVQLPLVTLLTSSQGTSQINAASGGNVMMPLLTTLDGTAVSVDASSSFNTSQISTFVNSSTTVTGYAANYGSVSNASGSTFSLNGGSLNLNNASDIDLASFYVTGGSTLSLPAATSYAGSTSHNTGTTTFQASGSGSVLSLPNLVTLTGCTDNWGGDYLNITASSGGLVQIPKVTTLPAGTYDISASGTGSAVQLPLVTLLTSSQGTSQINAASGGNVMMPLLTTLDGTAVSVDASSSFNTSQISTFVNSSTTVTGYAANYGSVSNASGSTFSLNGGSLNLNNASDIDLASFYVTGGSTLSLPAATSYAGSTSHNTGTTTFQASGSGSVLSLPNLVTLTGCTDNWGGDYLNITASSGGLVQIPKVTTLPAGTYDISASGTGSAVQLPLVTLLTSSQGTSQINAASGGNVMMPLLTTLDGTAVSVDASSSFNTSQISTFVNSSTTVTGYAANYGSVSNASGSTFSLNGGSLNLNNASDIDLASFYVTGGSTLSLPAATSYAGSTSHNTGTTTFQANGSGSVLSLPNLITLTGCTDNWGGDYLNITASSGGLVQIPKVTTLPAGTYDITATGNASVVQFNGTSFSAGQTASVNGSLSFTPTNLVTATGGTTTFDGSPLTQPLQLTNNAVVNLNQGIEIPGVLLLSPTSSLNISGSLIDGSKNIDILPAGKVAFDGTGTATAPQLMEVVSADLGATTAGFTDNGAYNSLALGNNTYVKLIDQYQNASGTGNEALYVNSLVVPAGCTLDLSGLNLYARVSLIQGTLIGGTITPVGQGGPIAFGGSAIGTVTTPGMLNEYSFFGRQGQVVSIDLNPGSGDNTAAASPYLTNGKVSIVNSLGVAIATMTGDGGGLVSIGNFTLPADGTYEIVVGGSTNNPNSTGNYSVTLWDSTPVISALTLNQTETGTFDSPYTFDDWNFSGVAGQQVQFKYVGETASATFTLTGPSGYTAFTNVSSGTQLVTLPNSGAYTLAVQPNDTLGSYAFNLNLISSQALTLGGSYTGSLISNNQAQLFTISVTTPNPLFISLADSGPDQNELYVEYNQAPTLQTYDFSAAGAGASQHILVPNARAGTWYILVYTNSVAAPPTPFTLSAFQDETVLTGSTPTEGAASTLTTLTITGAGFNSGSVVTLISSTGKAYPVTSTMVDLPTQITATIAEGTVPAGTYGIRVTQADGVIANLPNAFSMVSTGQAVLTTNIVVPNPIGYHIASTIYVDYSNTGTVAMPAPLLILSATLNGVEGALMTLNPALQTSGFWTSATPQGYSQSVQILASGSTPGVLQPGESVQIPVYYAGWLRQDWDLTYQNPIYFTLNVLQANDATPVNWSTSKASLQPPNINTAAWNTAFGSLQTQMGTTSGGYVQLLDIEATYLGRLGENVTSVQDLWSFAVQQADNALNPLSPNLASVTDDSLAMPGALSLSFTRSYAQSISGRDIMSTLGMGWSSPWQTSLMVGSDGTITIDAAGGGERIFEPDSRYAGVYFSSPGDTGTLAADGNGGYLLTEANGIETDYSANGSINFQRDTNGNYILAGYTSGRLASLTASSGQYLKLGYNSAGLVSTLTDSAGRVTTYTYDATNTYLISVASYNGQVTQYGYTPAAGAGEPQSLASISYTGGTHQYFTYDSQDRVASIYNDGGAQADTFAYNLGQVTIADGVGDTSSIYYNENGQVSKSVDGNGNPTYYSYNSDFNLVSVTNSAGQSETYTYNAVGEVTSSTDYLGGVTKYAYSGPYNQLSSFTDANGNPTSYSYNSGGDLLSTSYADNTQSTSTFNPLGEATSFLNQNGQTISYSYNAAGQMTAEQFSDGTQYTYTYDAYGNLLTATDPTGVTTFTYAPVTEWLISVVYSNGTSLTFSYNAAGQRTKMVDQTGFTVNYQYDSVGRLSGLTDGSGNSIVVYTYNAAGQLTKKVNGNGTYTTYTYDGDGNVLNLFNYAPNGSVNSSFVYTYNNLGLETSEATIDGMWTYNYDADGELAHALFVPNSSDPDGLTTQNLIYNYDATGNRTSTVTNGVTTVYTVNDMNEYTSVGGVAYTYDADGNLIAEGTTTNSYNVLNQLIKMVNPSATDDYTYNGLSQIISSTANGQLVTNLIDPAGGGSLFAEISGTGSSVSHFVDGLGLTAQISANGTLYYDFNVEGSTVGITNSQGSYLARFAYLPFGEEAVSAPAHYVAPFGFVGQYGIGNEDNALIEMRSRFYSPSIGRFLTSDSLGLLGGSANYFSYVHNDPIQFVDPTGHITFTQAVVGVAAIGLAIYFAPAALVFAAGIDAGLAAGEALGLASLFVNPAVQDALIDDAAGGYEIVQSAISWAIDQFDPSDAPPMSLPDLGFSLLDQLIEALGGGGESGTAGGAGGSGGSSGGGSGGGGSGGGGSHGGGGSGGGGGGSGHIPMPPGGGSGGGGSRTPSHPMDPNAKFGPNGYGSAGYIADSGIFPYRIDFENDPTATAPAQEVTITDQLSSSINWSSFQLTQIGFGDINLTIPANTQTYQTTVQMTYDGETFNVLILAGISVSTGLVYADFYSIDPTTGLPPNVLVGFLPPENGTGRGEGYVSYTVQPKAGLPTGTQISNVANISFNEQPYIATDEVNDENLGEGTDPAKMDLVTIDSVPPTSTVAALPATENTASFNVTWSGQDDVGGSGVASYTIYVSTNGGAYVPWLTGTTNTSGSYLGVGGDTYSFYSVATDNAGNVQATPTVAEATTTVVLGQPVTLTASAEYLELDADGLHLDIWNNTTPTGTPNQSILLSKVGSITVDGAAGGTSLTVNFTNGDPLIAAGLTFTGISGKPNVLNVIGTGGNDLLNVNGTTVTDTAAFGSAAISYSNLSAITFNGGSGNDTLLQSAQPGGNATLSYLNTTSSDTLNVSGGTYTFAASAAGSGVNPITLGSLLIGTGAKVVDAQSNGHTNRSVLILNNLSLAGSTGNWTGTLDLNDSDLDIHGGNLATITNQLKTGYNGGKWQGGGIESSTAASNTSHLTALGVIINNDGIGNELYGPGTGLGLFDAITTTSSTDILVKYTFYGDANLDGVVDGTDYERIDNGYLSHLAGWFNGDFNYDGAVDGTDYTLIDNAFNTQGTRQSLINPTFSLPAAPTLFYDGTSDATEWDTANLTGPAGQPSPSGIVAYVYYAGSSAIGTPLSTPPVNAGTYTVVATYSGDTTYSTAISNAVTFTINRVSPTVALTLPKQSVFEYDGTSDVTNWVQATVTGVATGSVPTGAPTFEYFSGTSATGTPLTAPPINVGTYTVVAVYAGDTNYLPATSASFTFTISSTTGAQPFNLSGPAFYLELDSDGQHLDVWDASTNAGSPSESVLLSGISSIAVNGVSGGTTLTVDFSRGQPLVPSGLVFTGFAGAKNTLNLIGTAQSDNVTVTGSTVTESAAFGSDTIYYANLSAITFKGGTGSDVVTQAAQPGGGASLTFLSTTASDTLNVNAGVYTFAPAAAGSGIQPIVLGTLEVGAGAKAVVAPSNAHASRSVLILNNLALAGSAGNWTGTLDLNDNDMIIHGGSTSTLTNQIANGYNNGMWTGAGITSSAASNDTTHLTALGIELNNNGTGKLFFGSGGSMGLFDGQNPISTDVLIKYTYYGDTNLDGKVDGSDYSRIDNGYLLHLTGWNNGDFNYSGNIDGSDYTLIDNAFNTQGAVLDASIAVPNALTAAQIAAPVSPQPSQKERVGVHSKKCITRTQSSFVPTVFSFGTPIDVPNALQGTIEFSMQDRDVLDKLTFAQ